MCRVGCETGKGRLCAWHPNARGETYTPALPGEGDYIGDRLSSVQTWELVHLIDLFRTVGISFSFLPSVFTTGTRTLGVTSVRKWYSQSVHWCERVVTARVSIIKYKIVVPRV